VSHRRLPEPLTAYRIGDAAGEWPVFSGEGSRKTEGRWNERGQNIMYLAQNLSTAVLEIIVRLKRLPPNQHYVSVTIPQGVSYEKLNPETLPGWHEANQGIARRFGSRWFEEQRSLILLVPSVVTRVDWNVLINPNHPEFAQVKPSLETPVYWDRRLFD
jgi:RES domain-containing protein